VDEVPVKTDFLSEKIFSEILLKFNRASTSENNHTKTSENNNAKTSENNNAKTSENNNAKTSENNNAKTSENNNAKTSENHSEIISENSTGLDLEQLALALLALTKRVYQQVYQNEMPENWYKNWTLCNDDISTWHWSFSENIPVESECNSIEVTSPEYETFHANKEDIAYFREQIFSPFPEDHVTEKEIEKLVNKTDLKKIILRKILREETDKFLDKVFLEYRLKKISAKYFPEVPLYEIFLRRISIILCEKICHILC